ncbi:spore germination lipoprotein GerD [Bacillus sp. FJAT-50079]|uniref:spore germination lipoprotein GerD n=1 Tax=Bacillus sp. FJAT-50079 TaxID=2833577 RepID=UPI001BC95239|nr:spore germination lipoprotein GerD [Bacillus sp. FJAT-50079]MBS4210635.1 spore gernimation protein GerD [Bacillus sp. FJAT-50079]
MKKVSILLLICAIFLLSSCNASGGGSEKLDYEQTKKMLVDILKTDEGKKAIQDILGDEKFKQQMVMDQAVVKETIEKELTSEKGLEFWKKAFQDPKFAESTANSMKTENEKLLKDLMKDPEYQGMMIDILKDPEVQKEFAQALKSKEFREQMQEVVTDTIESPLFKAKIQDILLKAAEEVGSEKKEKNNEKDQGGGGGESNE